MCVVGCPEGKGLFEMVCLDVNRRWHSSSRELSPLLAFSYWQLSGSVSSLFPSIQAGLMLHLVPIPPGWDSLDNGSETVTLQNRGLDALLANSTRHIMYNKWKHYICCIILSQEVHQMISKWPNTTRSKASICVTNVLKSQVSVGFTLRPSAFELVILRQVHQITSKCPCTSR